MAFRKIWLLAMAVCCVGSALAQESTPAAASSAPQPATPAPRPADAAPAPSAEQTSAAAATSDTASVADPAGEGKLDAEKIMAAQKAGYQIRNENGQQLLCRKEQQTGSRVRYKTSCMTAREWDQLQMDTAQSLRAIERRRPMLGNR